MHVVAVTGILSRTTHVTLRQLLIINYILHVDNYILLVNNYL